LHPEKMLQILTLSEKAFNLQDLEIEVEYQGITIQKFGLDLKGNNFLLTQKETACLAQEACGVSEAKAEAANSCAPGSGCC